MDIIDIKKIDAHIHILPEDVIDANSEYVDPYFETHKQEDYLEIMKKYNIEKAIIMPFNDPYLMSMEFTIEAVHNNLLKMKNKYPNYFYTFADIDVRNTKEKSLKEIDRVIKLGLDGIKIHPTNANMNVDDEYFEDIFKYAEIKQVPIEIHSYPKDNDRNDVCSPKRILNIIRKFPKLKLCVAHMGGFQYEALIDTNVYINISAILPDYVDRFGVKMANELLRKFKTNRILFATDYPTSRSVKTKDIYERYMQILGQMDFSKEELNRILYSNAISFLNH